MNTAARRSYANHNRNVSRPESPEAQTTQDFANSLLQQKRQHQAHAGQRAERAFGPLRFMNDQVSSGSVAVTEERFDSSSLTPSLTMADRRQKPSSRIVGRRKSDFASLPKAPAQIMESGLLGNMGPALKIWLLWMVINFAFIFFLF